MTDQRIVDVVQLIAGKVTAAEVAERHQVSPADVELWAKAYLAGLEGAAAGSRALGKRRWPAVLIGCLVVAGLASRVSFASGSTCGETLPGTLQPFCPDDPARASEVNQNYRALIAYIEARFGSFSSPDVTLPGAVSTSRATFNAVSFDGGSPTPLIVNDTVSQALVLVGQGTAPNRRVTVRDDLAVTSDLSVNGTTTLTGNTTIGGTLNVTGTLTAPNISGTISGGGTLICQLGSTAIVVNCAGQFGGATCPSAGVELHDGHPHRLPRGLDGARREPRLHQHGHHLPVRDPELLRSRLNADEPHSTMVEMFVRSCWPSSSTPSGRNRSSLKRRR